MPIDYTPLEYEHTGNDDSQRTLGIFRTGNQVVRSLDVVVHLDSDATVALEAGVPQNSNRKPDQESDLSWETIDSGVANGRSTYTNVPEQHLRLRVTTAGTGTADFAVFAGR